MTQARFVAAARVEFIAEVVHYRELEPALGARFAAAVEAATARARAFPLSGSLAPSNTRSVIVRGFPYSNVYRTETTGIVVFAVAHHSRSPYYWLPRVLGR